MLKTFNELIAYTEISSAKKEPQAQHSSSSRTRRLSVSGTLAGIILEKALES
ncbi:hypothetical protein [Peribacillus sp. SCS-37]|uniref:hypothetical protein n=1 Tax=Paraperibacillus esterisolvens TaxID=3115296 RepID=UPI003905D140